MRIALAGTRTFGVAALDALIDDGHDVAFVVAPADDKLTTRARFLGLTFFDRLDPEFVERSELDLIVAAHSHAFVSKRVREETRLGAIGYHPSALPRHRGRDAVKWTVHMKDAIAGGSVYWLTDNVDGGPLAAREFVHVDPRWDASDLWRKSLFPMGIRLLRGALRDLDGGKIVAVPQDERFATTEPSFDQPRLFRPDLIGLPPAGGYTNGFDHHVHEGAL